MKKIIIFLSLLLLNRYITYAQVQINGPGGNSPSGNYISFPGLTDYGSSVFNVRNYVRDYIPQQPTSDVNALTISSWYINPMISTKYTDGLGRPLQEVYRSAVPNHQTTDLITSHIYDANNREALQYLAYSKTGSSNSGKLQTSVYSDLSSFYTSIHPGEQPYSKRLYDNSPLNRIKKLLPPGSGWVGNNIGITIDRGLNSNSAIFVTANTVDQNIRKYTIARNGFGDLPTSSSYYNEGDLKITKTTDEDSKTMLTFSTADGKVVAIMNLLVSSENTSNKYYQVTYYVYDDFGTLRFVIPPQVSMENNNSGVIDQSLADGYCYQYWNNARGLVTTQKMPGKAIELLVYDKKDRLVLRQDGKLRADQNKWSFTTYDALDRPMMSGIVLSGLSQSTWESIFANDNYNNYSAQNLAYFLLKYDLYNEYENNFLYDATIYTKNYYDDYSNPALSSFSFDYSDTSKLTGGLTYAERPKPSLLTKGLNTGSKNLILDNTNVNWLTTVNYYDNKGELVQQQSNEIRGNDVTTYQYDFAGTLVSSVYNHYDARTLPGPYGSSFNMPYTLNIVKRYTKDYYSGTITKLEQNTNNFGWRTIFQNDYDLLGRITNKSYLAANNKFSYNIRHWLTGINGNDIDNATPPTNEFFFEKLFYEYDFTKPNYNGNISGVIWKNYGESAKKRFYGYTYDDANRLKHAEFGQIESSGGWPFPLFTWSKDTFDYTVSNIDYDYNGNLKKMNQRGPVPGSFVTPGNMDKLFYNYLTKSNQLSYIQDSGVIATLAPDFKDGHAGAGDYDYDENGNQIKDLNKGLSAITYNLYNQPTHIAVTNKGTIDYLYDGTGRKLRKTVIDNTGSTPTTTITEYVDPLTYSNGEIQYINHDEGRCRPIDKTVPNGEYKYDYFIKDHLGNVRTTINAEASSLGTLLYNTGLEVSLANTESVVWNNLDDVRQYRPEGTSSNVMAAELNADDPNKKIGPAMMLRVMPGDQFQISAQSYFDAFENSDASPTEDIVNSLLNTLSGGTIFNGTPVGEMDNNTIILQQTLGNPTTLTLMNGFLDANYNTDVPQSYLGYIFYNDNYEVVQEKSGLLPFGSGARAWQNIGTDGNVLIGEPGYLTIFAFTRTRTSSYIDQLTVAYSKGSVLEQTEHYYPFGLTLTNNAGTTDEKNSRKYQSIDLVKSLDLEIYETPFRSLDPQTGRFNQHDPLSELHFGESPYVSMGNNPSNNMDPLGLDWYADQNGFLKFDEKLKAKDGEAGMEALGLKGKYIGSSFENIPYTDKNGNTFNLSGNEAGAISATGAEFVKSENKDYTESYRRISHEEAGASRNFDVDFGFNNKMFDLFHSGPSERPDKVYDPNGGGTVWTSKTGQGEEEKENGHPDAMDNIDGLLDNTRKLGGSGGFGQLDKGLNKFNKLVTDLLLAKKVKEKVEFKTDQKLNEYRKDTVIWVVNPDGNTYHDTLVPKSSIGGDYVADPTNVTFTKHK